MVQGRKRVRDKRWDAVLREASDRQADEGKQSIRRRMRALG